MRYTLENEFLTVQAESLGAELVSVVDKATGAEMLWHGDPKVWPRQAPILFPYCGKLRGGRYTLDGAEYQCPQHGIARDYEHEFLGVSGSEMRFCLRSGADTLERFPRGFELTSSFCLHGRTLRHTLAVKNTGEKELRFGIGYHPGFAFPFDEKHTTEDYELRFDTPQTPAVIETGAGEDAGLVTGETRLLMKKSAVIPMDDRMFDSDSICMGALSAKTLSIVEKDSGRAVRVGIEGYPYVLIWSMPGDPALQFICVEPWHSLPDRADAAGDWNEKPCAAALAPGGEWHTDLNMTFDR